jgi:uncharacterized NAD(P)/FAD-binding protein YdhS
MKEPSHHVAVIGGGATGAALTIQLVRHLPAGSRVVLLGSPREIGRGVAYGTSLPAHLLNVRAGRMSVIHDDPAHFTRWLIRKGIGGSEEEVAESYIPRATYGDYVLDTLKQAIAHGAGRVQVEVVESTATEIVERDGVYTVRAAHGIRYSARAMALCLGHGQPEFPLPAETIDPDARDRMIADAWTDRRLGRIGRDDRVLIVGTGLTMVDQLLALDARGHRGPITAVSRRGFLPAGHCPRRTDPFLIALPDSLRSIRELFRQVVAAARDEDAAGRDWRAVIDGLRPVTQDLWRRLDHAERRRFCRHVECIWSVVRHRMAPSIANRVATAQSSGRLEVRSGRIVAVKHARNGVIVGLQARGGRTVELASFDWLLNCSGVGRVPVSAVEPPLGPLVSQGHIRADRLGRGIDITPAGEAIARSGRPSKGLFGLGPLGAGSLMEITAMPDIRAQCADVAARIAADLAAEQPAPRMSGRSVLRISG